MGFLNFVLGKIKCENCVYGYNYQWKLYQKQEGITLTGAKALSKGVVCRPPHCSISQDGYCWWNNCPVTPLISWYMKKRIELTIKEEE